MDVDKIAFPSRLLQILEALSEAHFVSIDFEFSGIASKPAARQKQTIQERYVETKQAAEKYQILQAGLTCAIQDKKKQKYVLQPFNIPLTPVFDEDLDLERQFSFQSGAVEFLIRNAFNFNVSFEHGVPYLSREEELEAKERFKARDNKGRFEDIEIMETDSLTLEFLEKVRKEVKEWINKSHEDSVEILSRTMHWKEKEETGGDLTSFDKRLIHQLIRNEFPTLITISRRQSILIKEIDEGREHQVRKDKYKRLKKKIYVQTGFRWIIEAMTGGSLGHIDLTWFARDPQTGTPRYYDTIAFEARFHRACDKLKRKRPAIVGHNCFTDLIYLYAAFIGKLPETVSEFQHIIHDLFPSIIDTKYLFTHNCGNLNPASSLDAIEEALRVQEVPRIETHEDHGKYETEDMYHEAGYDSYLTARVAILLSTKLEALGTYVIEGDEVKNQPSTTPSKDDNPSPIPQVDEAENGTGNTLVDALQNSKYTNNASRKKPPVSPQPTSRFATKTLFEALASTSPLDNESEEESTVVGSSFVLNPGARPFPISLAPEGAADFVSGKNKAKQKADKKGKELNVDALMPPFNSDFWRVYANKLRVFGTVEGLLDLDPTRKP